MLQTIETFAAYNICVQGSLGKLQGQGVTHFWRIRMEEDPNGGLCNLFFVFISFKCAKYTKKRVHSPPFESYKLCDTMSLQLTQTPL